MSAILTIRELAKLHGSRPVFTGVNFTLLPGERLAVVGESGTGKTTLLRLIAGLEKPSAGSIERDPNARIGMVFQDLALWPNLTALGNVALALPHLSGAARRVTAKAALNSCKVGEFASRRPATLSIGQQQRVALARSLGPEPHLLLLDEPFTSLDLPLKLELLHEVHGLTQARQIAVILVTHDLREAEALCPSTLVLEDGRITVAGDWNTVRSFRGCRLLDTWWGRNSRLQ